MAEPAADKFSELLHFHPKFWWDPVPWWFVTQLDKNALKEIAVIQMEVQKEMLTAQAKGIDRTLAALSKGR